MEGQRQEIAALASAIKENISTMTFSPHDEELGRVMQVGNGIASVSGLQGVVSGELIQFEDSTYGIAMNLDEETIGTVLLSSGVTIKEGGFVSRTGRVAMMPVGDDLLGRVVNALGEPIDQNGQMHAHQVRPIERVAPGVLARQSVDVPLLTGIKAIDAMVPIGRGQRQLIIGDRQTGKTAIALDTILNQKDTGVLCVYVAIGQKNSTVAGLVGTLSEYDAMRYTTVVVAGASEPAPLQYLAPYSGVAAAEYWMEQGKDVLIVFDDLSKHAVAYRTMSLLLRRPPGREAYPGDVFYLHSRLLERAGRLSQEFGGGSITALPIIETQSGDMSAYIPTNVISITDGQIYLETESFNAGVRPAINPGLSVSRVGGAAQVKAMKKIAGPMRIELAQYRELASFMQFSSDLDDETRDRLRHGERIVEIFKQQQFKPLSLENEIIVLFAVQHGCFAEIKIEDMQDFEYKLIDRMKTWNADMVEEIAREKDISPELETRLLEAIQQFKSAYQG
ncbi:MAG: F0F1 ATP synthase subunit alpha [Clostridiales bacterium]|nr:F0F1 ATP synthase subunit alpha [Clostridiales bacterium]